ncbi:MAG: hypothetical protein R3F39_25855 [Myxococcota bacterium]
MKQVIYAEFASHAAAEDLRDELTATPEWNVDVDLIDHPPEIEMEALSTANTSARRGLLSAGLLGAVAGAIIGLALVWPFGLIGSDILSGVLLGAVAGFIYAALFGLLMGSANPSRELRKAADDTPEQHTLLAVATYDQTTADLIRSVASARGAVRIQRSRIAT